VPSNLAVQSCPKVRRHGIYFYALDVDGEKGVASFLQKWCDVFVSLFPRFASFLLPLCLVLSVFFIFPLYSVAMQTQGNAFIVVNGSRLINSITASASRRNSQPSPTSISVPVAAPALVPAAPLVVEAPASRESSLTEQGRTRERSKGKLKHPVKGFLTPSGAAVGLRIWGFKTLSSIFSFYPRHSR
jgi:hypothetical protein